MNALTLVRYICESILKMEEQMRAHGRKLDGQWEIDTDATGQPTLTLKFGEVKIVKPPEAPSGN